MFVSVVIHLLLMYIQLHIVIHTYTNIIITYHEPQQCFIIGSIKFSFLIKVTQYNKIRHTVVILLSSNVKN